MAVLVVVALFGSISESYFTSTYGDLPLVCKGVVRTDRNDCAIEINTNGNKLKEIEIITGDVAKGICVKSPDCAAFRNLVAELRRDLIGTDPFLLSDESHKGVKLVDSFVDKSLKLFPKDSAIAALLEDYRSSVKAIICHPCANN